MSDMMFDAYDSDGRPVGRFRTRDEADEASRHANAARRQRDAEIADENELLRAKPSTDDKRRVAALGPGLHLSVAARARHGSGSFVFRGISVAPYTIYGLFLLIVAVPVTIVAWGSLVLTGQYPLVLFAFNARVLRYLVRLTGYSLLLVDTRPPLSGAANPLYPIQVDVNALPTYNRMLALARLPLLLPLAAATFLASIVVLLAVMVSFAVVRLTRRQPGFLRAAEIRYLRLYAQFLAAATLLSEAWVPGRY